MPSGESVVDSNALDVHEAAQSFESMFAAADAGTEQTEVDTPSQSEKPAPKQKAATVPDAAEDDDEQAETAEADDKPDDDAEAESDDDEQSESEPEKPAEPSKHKVKVRGEEIEVTLDEALKGYSRTEDYTRDKQAVAAERKAFEAEKAAITQERQNYHARITALDEALTAQTTEPDWDALRAQDPDLFVQAHAAWSVQKGRLDAVKAEREKVERQLAQDALEAHEGRLKEETRLLFEKAPEFSDPTEGKAKLTALFDYGQKQGYTPQELSGVGDHRAMLLLRKAMLYDQMQADTVKTTEKAERKIEKVKTATPGSASSQKAKSTEYTRSRQRLAKSGSIDDAASALSHLF